MFPLSREDRRQILSLSNRGIHLFVCAGVLCMILICSVHGESREELIKKQAQIIKEYEVLVRDLLIPAGVDRKFTEFVLRNPTFMENSYTRSRTAFFIKDLLKDKPEYLALFSECGLSKQGEYMCGDPQCPVHGRYYAGAKPQYDFKRTIYYLFSVLGGVVGFVLLTGLGTYVCGWLDKKFPEKEEHPARG
jgi:hypothetical protein